MRGMILRLTRIMMAAGILISAGCERSPDNEETHLQMELSVPLEGTWQFPRFFEEDIYLLISCKQGEGLIRVEKAGLIAHTYRFDVTASDAIRIRDAHGAPIPLSSVFSGAFMDIAELKDPPADIRIIVKDVQLKGLSKPTTQLILMGIIEGDSELLCYSRMEGDDRRQLPFKQVTADVDLKIPDGTESHFIEDGTWGISNIRFDEPVHPEGEVRSLLIHGMPILIAQTQLVNGMLRTRDFGELEFFLTTPMDFTIFASRPQVDAIRDSLMKQRSIDP